VSAAARSGPVVLVNNSRETFTPTVSGAIGTCLWELCRAANEADEHPIVITPASDAEPYPWPFVHIVKTRTAHRGPVSGRLARVTRRLTGWARMEQRTYARQVVPVLRRLDPATVICNNDLELAVYLRRNLPDVRVVHWFHNLELVSDRPRRRYVRDRSMVSVAVSAYLARAVETVYQLEPLSVAVAMNGVDTVRFHPDPDRRPRPPVFGFVGRICVEKAPDVFLRACLLLSETRSDFAVQLVGDTNWGHSEPTAVRRLVDELVAELSDRGIAVRRTGHLSRAEVSVALRSSDVHVVPSRWDEPCGLTLFEGLATGVPVVASATGGSPEVVGDAGLLFPRDDVISLAAALARLLDDPAERVALGKRARGRAEGLSWVRTWTALLAAAEPNDVVGGDSVASTATVVPTP
jgi:glycosyltransferase involved in cell wall biosynthesis